MAYGFELEIHKRLTESDNPVQVADELLKKWDRGELSWKDQEAASEFLLNAGFTSALLHQISKSLRLRQKIPWACFLEGLARSSAQFTKDEVDQILVGAGEEDSLGSMCRSRALDSIDSRFEKIRTNNRIERQSRVSKTSKPAPLAQITLISDRTRPMVENIKVRKITLAEWAKRADEISPDTKEKIATVSALMIEQSRKDKTSAYDIAISLRFMGLPDQALEALRHSPPSTAALWLELDLLLETQRFIEVLEKSREIEDKLTSDPDASFSATYTRAIALHALGQKQEAIELLESIVRLKPTYRSAHSYLLKWKSGEEK